MADRTQKEMLSELLERSYAEEKRWGELHAMMCNLSAKISVYQGRQDAINENVAESIRDIDARLKIVEEMVGG